MSTDISSRNNWPAQRKPADDRKNNFAKTGEMLVSSGLGRVTSSDFQKPLMNDFPLDPKKPATMKYGGSMLDNEPFQIDNKNSRKAIKTNLQEENYQLMNNNLNRDLNQIDKALSQKTKALERYGNNYEPSSSTGYSGSSQTYQAKEFAKPSFSASKTENKQELYSSPTHDEMIDFSPNNIPSRIPKNTLNSTRSKLTQSNSSTSDDFGLQFNKPKLTKNYSEDESPTLAAFPSKPTFEPKLTHQNSAPEEKPKLFESLAQKNKAPESLLPKLNSTAKSAITNPNQEDKGKEKEKEQDYNKAFSKPSFKKAPLPPANNKKARAAKIPNEDVHQDRGPLKECPHGCGRSFAADALESHAKACQKVFQNKRKQFDSTQQRTTDELAQTMSNFGAKKGQKDSAASKGKGAAGDKWKQNSEALRDKIKAAKNPEELAKIKAAKEKEELGELKQCPHGCGRSFNVEAFEKHAKVCQKVFQNKRKQFDSGQQRVTDELAQTMTGFGAKKPESAQGKKDGKWKEQSEAFRANIKAAANKK